MQNIHKFIISEIFGQANSRIFFPYINILNTLDAFYTTLNFKITNEFKITPGLLANGDVSYTKDVQIIRKSKLTNSSLVGHGSFVKVEVDKTPGAVEALRHSRGSVVFVRRVNSSFERGRTSPFLVSWKAETAFFDCNGDALEARSCCICPCIWSFCWLSNSDIFL